MKYLIFITGALIVFADLMLTGMHRLTSDASFGFGLLGAMVLLIAMAPWWSE